METNNTDSLIKTTTAENDKTQKPSFTKDEYIIVLISLAVGILCDRLVFNQMTERGDSFFFFTSIFWLVFTLIYSIYHRKELMANKPALIITFFTLLLCTWSVTHDPMSNYGGICFLLVPCAVILQAAMIKCHYPLQSICKYAIECLHGLFAKPFTAVHKLVYVAGSVTDKSNNRFTKNLLIGLLIAAPLLVIIVPLLRQADMVFNYYIENALDKLNISDALVHIALALAASALVFSFMWNMKYSRNVGRDMDFKVNLDAAVFSIVLGIMVLLYTAFCIIQFTFLFAQAGLPEGMTYSNYARGGFFQLIGIVSINLLAFGVILRYIKRDKVLNIMMLLLLATTVVMEISALMRLKLYIDVHGFTWLRLISLWFIIFLFVLVALCIVRIYRARFPLIATSAILLMGWFAALGYLNPDAFIMRHNLARQVDKTGWMDTNSEYYTTLSDDAMLVICQQGIKKDFVDSYLKSRYDEAIDKHNVSSRRFVQAMKGK